VQRPKIKDYEETIDELIKTNKSIVRFGDGEIAIMENGEAAFQKYHPVLAQRLKNVLQSQDEDLMVCINYHYYYPDLLDYLDFPKLYYRTSVKYFRDKLNPYLIPGKQYYTAGFTQMYHTFKSYDCLGFYNRVRSVWEGREVTIICGDKTFANIRYNIFDNAKSVNYIYGPFKNAMDEYDELLNKARNIKKSDLVILILGPTAKVLAYDLHLLGYRVLDLGHIAKDYDLLMKDAQRTEGSTIEFFQD
jgi:glycosyltransferase family protein